MLLHVDAARLKALKDYYGESIAFYFEFMVFCATKPTHSPGQGPPDMRYWHPSVLTPSLRVSAQALLS